MNKELKDNWVQALRSGKYKQGQGKLRQADDAMCCLAVLCDVSGKGEWVQKSPGYWNYRYGSETGYAILPKSLEKEVFDHSLLVDTLIQMNDQQGKSFNEIADFIEARL